MNNSPKPPKKQKRQMTFNEAITLVLTGASVTKLEWGDKNYHVLLADQHLKLHKPDGKLYDWVLSEADLRGDDYAEL